MANHHFGNVSCTPLAYSECIIQLVKQQRFNIRISFADTTLGVMNNPKLESLAGCGTYRNQFFDFLDYLSVKLNVRNELIVTDYDVFIRNLIIFNELS